MFMKMLKGKKNFILVISLISFFNLNISAKLSKDESKPESKELKRSHDLESEEEVVVDQEQVAEEVKTEAELAAVEVVTEEESPSVDSGEESLVVVVVDGDYICTDMKGIAEFRGVEGKPNNLYLTEDVQIDHKVTFNNLTIVGDAGTRGGKRFGLETVGGGFVSFGKEVTLKNCLIKNLKQQSVKKHDTK